jgi:hypothetical protein
MVLFQMHICDMAVPWTHSPRGDTEKPTENHATTQPGLWKRMVHGEELEPQNHPGWRHTLCNWGDTREGLSFRFFICSKKGKNKEKIITSED